MSASSVLTTPISELEVSGKNTRGRAADSSAVESLCSTERSLLSSRCESAGLGSDGCTLQEASKACVGGGGCELLRERVVSPRRRDSTGDLTGSGVSAAPAAMVVVAGAAEVVVLPSSLLLPPLTKPPIAEASLLNEKDRPRFWSDEVGDDDSDGGADAAKGVGGCSR